MLIILVKVTPPLYYASDVVFYGFTFIYVPILVLLGPLQLKYLVNKIWKNNWMIIII